MSGETDYRRYAGTPSPKPKYLSDSLTPWYGYWASHGAGSTISIAYDTLPIGDALARVFSTQPTVNGGPGIVFNTPQNLNDCYLEIYYKASVAGASGMYIQFNDTVIPLLVGYKTVYCFTLGGAVVPTVWTKYTLNISEIRTKVGFGSNLGLTMNLSAFLSRVKSIILYSAVVAPLDIIVSGFNIRRL
jgi:hypothetical protein